MVKFLFNALILSVTSFAFSQGDIKIVHASDLATDISGTTIEVTGDPSDPTIYHDMRVINLSGQTIELKYKRARLANSGVLDQICDENLCYDADDQYEYTSPALISVDHEDTTLFKPQIVPANNESCGIHDYYVVNSFGIVYDSVRIKFRTNNSNCFLDIEESETAENNTFNMFPNPAENSLTIENLKDSDETIVVYDALGKQVLSSTVAKSSKNIKLNTLKSGIYFVRVMSKNGALSDPRKLIVRK